MSEPATEQPVSLDLLREHLPEVVKDMLARLTKSAPGHRTCWGWLDVSMDGSEPQPMLVYVTVDRRASAAARAALEEAGVLCGMDLGKAPARAFNIHDLAPVQEGQ